MAGEKNPFKFLLLTLSALLMLPRVTTGMLRSRRWRFRVSNNFFRKLAHSRRQVFLTSTRIYVFARRSAQTIQFLFWVKRKKFCNYLKFTNLPSLAWRSVKLNKVATLKELIKYIGNPLPILGGPFWDEFMLLL